MDRETKSWGKPQPTFSEKSSKLRSQIGPKTEQDNLIDREQTNFYLQQFEKELYCQIFRSAW